MLSLTTSSNLNLRREIPKMSTNSNTTCPCQQARLEIQRPMGGKTSISETKFSQSPVVGVSDLERMQREQVKRSRKIHATMTMCSTISLMKSRRPKVLSRRVKDHRQLVTAESVTSERAFGLQEVEIKWEIINIKTMILTTLRMKMTTWV